MTSFSRLFVLLLRLVAFGVTVWGIGAFYYDLPWAAWRVPVAAVYGVVMIGLLLLWRRGWIVALAGFALVLGWWKGIAPRGDLPWQPDVAQTAFAEIEGDIVTLHNVRHCDYRTETDYTPHWSTRTVDTRKITGIDLSLVSWGSRFIAHTIVSFRVEGEPPIAISIETRKQIGQEYSTIAGFYRQYGLIYIVSDERDVIRLRTNYRQDEIVHLYSIRLRPEKARQLFLSYLQGVNALHRKPEFYNALTSNCTTNIRTHTTATADHPTPWDWRILANGYLDELLYQHHAINGVGTFPELRERSIINEEAHAIGDAPDFSRRIREAIGL